MEWALGRRWEDVNLFEFETRLNYVIPKYEDWVICWYNLPKFGASVMMDALRTHPVVIIGGLVWENRSFLPSSCCSRYRSGGSVGRQSRRHGSGVAAGQRGDSRAARRAYL